MKKESQILPFEKPLIELEEKINELKEMSAKEEDTTRYSEAIKELNKELKEKYRKVFANLGPIEKTQLARHQARPQTLDYINMITTDFVELQGDRNFGDGKTIIGGFARIEKEPVLILGHQKGKTTAEKLHHNFGMANPEDFRKALRLMKLAEKFHRPVVTFLDTAGAYPGIGAEERGQAEAIAKNLFEMAGLKVPVITVVIGEGGSGGALGIGVANRVIMLEHSVYSVISPEGCAAILWKDATKAGEAAEALNLTAQHLKKFNIIEEVLKEPVGAAHRNPVMMGNILRRALRRHLAELKRIPPDDLQRQRYEKFRHIGLDYIS